MTSPSFGDGRRSTVNKSYEPHHGIKLKKFTRLYQKEGLKQGDRATSKHVVLLNKKIVKGEERKIVKKESEGRF